MIAILSEVISSNWAQAFIMSVAVLRIIFNIQLLTLFTNAVHLSRIVAREGNDVTLPFEHMGRCSAAIRLCHLPLDGNGSAHVDVTACWTPRCKVLSSCAPRSTFVTADKYKDRLGTEMEEPEGLNSDVIFNISARDAGIYQFCPSWKKDAEVAMLIIHDQPTDPYIHAFHLPVLDTDYTLTCLTNSTSIPTNHGLNMNYLWMQNGEAVKNNPDIGLTGPHLTISKLSLIHDGLTYSCRVREERGHWSKYSPVSTVSVQYGPRKVDLIVTEEDSGHITLTCSADCRPACHVEFQNDAREVASAKDTVTLHFDKLPTIGAVYICTASNIHTTISKIFKFHRNHHTQRITDLTANQKHKTHIVIKKNQALEFSCIVIGRPEPIVTWYYAERKFNQSRKLLKTSTFNPAYVANVATDVNHRYNSVYTLPNVECEHTGWYYCHANNGLGIDFQEKYIKVTVKCSPKVELFPLTSVRTGQALKLDLNVISYEQPSISFSKVEDKGTNHSLSALGINLTSDRYRPIIHHVTLYKEVVEPQDIGLYVITISNGQGTLEEEFHLSLNDTDDSVYKVLYIALSGGVVGVVSLVCLLMVLVLYVRRHRSSHRHDDVCVGEFHTGFGSIGSLATQDSILTYNTSRRDSGCISTGDGSKSPSVVRLLRNMESSSA